MKSILFILLSLLTISVYSQQTITINHKYYTMTYDTAQRSEIVGFYIQTREHAAISNDKSKSVDRKTVSAFKQDTLVPSYIQKIVTNDEYSKINDSLRPIGLQIDKGHVVPYSSMAFSLDAALESMYIENTCPQAYYFNEHQWQRLEMYVQKEVSPKYGDVKVWTGVLISSSTPRKVGKLFFPDFYWKVIQYIKDGKMVTESWLGENTFENKSTNPVDIKCDLDKLKATILQYYPKLKLEF